jgi:phosphatidylserine decarboxylase
MLFQVLRHEHKYSLNFSVIDRDKLSGNDFVGTASLPLQDIISAAPDADPETGLYRLKEPPSPSTLAPVPRSRFRLPMSRSSSSTNLVKVNSRPSFRTQDSAPAVTKVHSQPEQASTPTSAKSTDNLAAMSNVPAATEADDFDAEGDPELIPFSLPLALKNKDRWESKHSPELFIKAKYVPYPALRQQFWRALLRQYNADDSGTVSKVELSTMLDTLGSTLKESTIDGFFRRFAATNGVQDLANATLTYDQAVICLEDQIMMASREKTWAEALRKNLPTNMAIHLPDHLPGIPLPSHLPGLPHVVATNGDSPSPGSPSFTTSSSEALSKSQSQLSVPALTPSPLASPGEEGDMLGQDDLVDEKGEEHVIEIRECPICHQPRMNKKSDADIITHIATCASHDWRRVNNIVMAGFVTPSQAQRKWYSKVITKISYGGYKLGANSANILVQDRLTGQINEERMSVYVRLGIRLLYKGLKSREMEKKRSESYQEHNLSTLTQERHR